MNLSRKTFVTDAVPPVGFGRAARRNFGSDAYVEFSKAEIAAVKSECLPDIADPEDGIIGLGPCMDSATRQPCRYSEECNRLARAHAPLICHVRKAALSEREAEQQRKTAWRKQAALILNYMRKHSDPLTFREVCAGLGYAETPMLIKSGWNLLHRTQRIVCVSGYTRGGKYRHHRTWIIKRGNRNANA